MNRAPALIALTAALATAVSPAQAGSNKPEYYGKKTLSCQELTTKLPEACDKAKAWQEQARQNPTDKKAKGNAEGHDINCQVLQNDARAQDCR